MSDRIFIVEDHGLLAMSLQLALSARGWCVETTDGPTAADIVEEARLFQPRCVLLDLYLGERVGSGMDLIAPMRAIGADVVMLTAESRRMVLAACLEAGAAGWIGKQMHFDDVVATLEGVLAGASLIGCADREALLDELRITRDGSRRALTPFERLTIRERAVLAALVDGLSAEEIATAQFVSLTTVRSQIRAVLQKLGVRSQLAAVAHANRLSFRPAGPHARRSDMALQPNPRGG